jgi:hypothetical protein
VFDLIGIVDVYPSLEPDGTPSCCDGLLLELDSSYPFDATLLLSALRDEFARSASRAALLDDDVSCCEDDTRGGAIGGSCLLRLEEAA